MGGCGVCEVGGGGFVWGVGVWFGYEACVIDWSYPLLRIRLCLCVCVCVCVCVVLLSCTSLYPHGYNVPIATPVRTMYIHPV